MIWCDDILVCRGRLVVCVLVSHIAMPGIGDGEFESWVVPEFLLSQPHIAKCSALTALSLVDNWNQIQTYPEQQLRNGDRIIAAAVSDICHVPVRDSHDGMA